MEISKGGSNAWYSSLIDKKYDNTVPWIIVRRQK